MDSWQINILSLSFSVCQNNCPVCDSTLHALPCLTLLLLPHSVKNCNGAGLGNTVSKFSQPAWHFCQQMIFLPSLSGAVNCPRSVYDRQLNYRQMKLLCPSSLPPSPPTLKSYTPPPLVPSGNIFILFELPPFISSICFWLHCFHIKSALLFLSVFFTHFFYWPNTVSSTKCVCVLCCHILSVWSL